ncbi:hypothetical protein [sulfur-oxidizing endosymbiont of Gigantopelta aegis]|uniref:hypothetical protein n=1 Tax=sulfur-oxidizing endosymbiont of Gigantopelta aegis TaxID=2794934 RepID=UPI0018DC3300|nr:hypothetical protein [sulfur-oxidizing endosymbiont of Gigantopelta aegis]
MCPVKYSHIKNYSLQASQFLVAREKLTEMSLRESQKEHLAKQRIQLKESQNFLDNVINAIREGDKKNCQSKYSQGSGFK